MVSLVLRADVIPRATVSSGMALLSELAAFQGWRDDAAQDWQSAVDRAKTLWRPQVRQPPESLTLTPTLSLSPTQIAKAQEVAVGQDDVYEDGGGGGRSSRVVTTVVDDPTYEDK